jgi:hypothetical protein
MRTGGSRTLDTGWLSCSRSGTTTRTITIALRSSLLAACDDPRLFGFRLWPLQRGTPRRRRARAPPSGLGTRPALREDDHGGASVPVGRPPSARARRAGQAGETRYAGGRRHQPGPGPPDRRGGPLGDGAQPRSVPPSGGGDRRRDPLRAPRGRPHRAAGLPGRERPQRARAHRHADGDERGNWRLG